MSQGGSQVCDSPIGSCVRVNLPNIKGWYRTYLEGTSLRTAGEHSKELEAIICRGFHSSSGVGDDPEYFTSGIVEGSPNALWL